MVQAVRSSIVKDINESDVKWFTLMEDGTRDKNNRENIALAIRYVKDGVVNESLLMVKTTENLDAATFTELTHGCGQKSYPRYNLQTQLCKPSAGLKDAITIIKCVKDEIIKLRSNQMYNQILEEAKSLTSNDCGESENRTQTSKRQVKKPNRMDDYLTYTPCSSARQNIDENDEPFKSEYFETLDILIAELQRRFSDNDDLINSIASLDELDVDKMVPLKNLGLKIPSREEASVVKAYLSRNEDIMENTLQVLYRQREAFKDTYELFASVATIGCSTAVCESTFSTLTAINRPQRLSMGHERMAGMEFPSIRRRRNLPLALLHHCSDVVGKSTYGKVNIVCRHDVVGNDVKGWSVDFLKLSRHSFPISNFTVGFGLPLLRGPIFNMTGQWSDKRPCNVSKSKSARLIAVTPCLLKKVCVRLRRMTGAHSL
ncbi:hypothetical protein EVAR_5267_1 [Eumeta japonica]|uniref:Uncharacterized protein n=1 Tax=Eumeta variegata TaxID=151549 RepID=A0A4C1SKT1_EUMVA|nr:hypothetical protein EVAR_5267_1 [Eumeta japonica]